MKFCDGIDESRHLAIKLNITVVGDPRGKFYRKSTSSKGLVYKYKKCVTDIEQDKQCSILYCILYMHAIDILN